MKTLTKEELSLLNKEIAQCKDSNSVPCPVPQHLVLPLLTHAEETVGLPERFEALQTQHRLLKSVAEGYSRTDAWMRCPVCGEYDMPRVNHGDGNFTINCTNHACGSNGGDNFSAVPSTSAYTALKAGYTALQERFDKMVGYSEMLKREAEAKSPVPSRAEIAMHILAELAQNGDPLGLTEDGALEYRQRRVKFSVEMADLLVAELQNNA